MLDFRSSKRLIFTRIGYFNFARRMKAMPVAITPGRFSQYLRLNQFGAYHQYQPFHRPHKFLIPASPAHTFGDWKFCQCTCDQSGQHRRQAAASFGFLEIHPRAFFPRQPRRHWQTPAWPGTGYHRHRRRPPAPDRVFRSIDLPVVAAHRAVTARAGEASQKSVPRLDSGQYLAETRLPGRRRPATVFSVIWVEALRYPVRSNTYRMSCYPPSGPPDNNGNPSASRDSK